MIWRVAALAAISATGCLLQACAVKEDGGRLRFGVDNAQLFGQTVASFKLADGGEGSLRILNGCYSVKLHNRLKVIPLESGVVVARLLRAQVLDGRTVLFIETGERSCSYKMLVLSIQGGEVLSWNAGDCTTKPLLAVDGDQATIDFARPGRLTRYTYTDARLIRTESVITPPPVVAAVKQLPSPVASSAVSAASAAATTQSTPPPATKVATASPSPTPRPAAKGTPRAVPPRSDASIAFPAPRSAPLPPVPLAAPGVLTFPTQEQKPVRIVLDR